MISVGKRPLGRVLGAFLQKRHYRALKNMFLVYPQPFQNLNRYVRNGGTYPYQIEIKTPLGLICPTLYSFHDLQTVNEIFCRLDYCADKNTRVVVDIGSNIGISALYFLTRNPFSKVFLFEPVSINIERLHANLIGFEKRYQLHPVAVADFNGTACFSTEATGRYGGISKKATPQTISVPCSHINQVLETILTQESWIDILKIDIEGHEMDVLNSIEKKYLEKIGTIYIEAPNQPFLTLQGFKISSSGDIQKYHNES